jgi:hypothetical protein
MKCLLPIIILTGVMSNVFAWGTSDITGTYNCTGNDPTSTPSEFSGKITILKQGSSYSIQEIDPEATAPALTYQEVGILNGNILSIAFQQAQTNSFGIQAYKISHNGKTLTGPFVYWGKFEEKGTETCEKIS